MQKMFHEAALVMSSGDTNFSSVNEAIAKLIDSVFPLQL